MPAYLDHSFEGFFVATSLFSEKDCYEMLLKFDSLEDREAFERELVELGVFREVS
jgi:hypothetical protein